MGKLKKELRTFTTRVPVELFAKIKEVEKLGGWRNNQMMNVALDVFFEIIEAEEEQPTLPLITEIIREMKKRSGK